MSVAAEPAKKKIMHLIFSLTIGGAENLMIDLLNEQVKFAESHAVIVNDLYNETLLKQIDPRVKVHMIRRPAGSRNPFKIVQLNMLLLAVAPDVVHCHNHNMINMMFSFRKKTLLTIHDVNMATGLLGKYRTLVAISGAVKEDVQARSGKALQPETIYNAINFGRIERKQNFNVRAPFKMVQVSRLMHEKKGQDVLLRAMELLVKDERYNEVQLDLIGHGESKEYLLQLIADCGLQQQVRILDDKDRTWIYAHLKDYDLLVQPSRYEGFGLTIIEGMAAGLPVVASRLDGPKEILQDGSYGELFESENAAELAEKIKVVMDSYRSAQVTAQSKAAYDYCIQHFSLRSMVDSYNSAYMSLN